MQQVFQEFPHAKSAQIWQTGLRFQQISWPRLTRMRFGNLKMDVPEGQMKISPAFQRWDVYQTRPSPGTADKWREPFRVQPSLRDSNPSHVLPGVETPGYSRDVLRDNRSRSEWARTKNNSNKNRARRGARTGPAPGPTAGGCSAGNAYSLRHVCSRAFEKPGRKR